MSDDEPCMCGTPFTCAADDHDAAVRVGVALSRVAVVAGWADRLAADAKRDPGMYPDPAEGFRWAAEQIRAAIKEAE